MYMNPINTFRVSGLASGIDTESIVKQLMTVERLPLDRLKQNRQIIEWTQAAYRDMNSALLAFRNQVSNMRLQGNFLANKVMSSNESVATATASGSATGSVYDINIDQLAASAKAISTDGISNLKSVLTGQGITASVTIDSSSNSFHLKVGSNTAVITLAEGAYNTAGGLAAAIQAAINAKASELGIAEDAIKVYATPDNKLRFVSDSSIKFELTPTDTNNALSKLGFDVPAGSSIKSTVQGVDINTPINQMIREGRLVGVSAPYADNLDFSITTYNQEGTAISQTFTIDPNTQSLQDVISAIQNSGLGLTGFYDAASDKIAFTSKYTGNNNAAGADIEFGGDDADFLNNVMKFGIVNETKRGVTDGQDASFTINGLTTSRKSNTFALNGVTFTLKSAGAATISVQQDTDAIVNKIKDFVTQYNDIMDKVNSALTEKRYRNYLPLTDEQKDAMSDKEIEKWEEKAKSGLLNGDSILYKSFYDMRNAISRPVEGVNGSLNSMSKLGITSGLWYENGRLYIDEAKLRDAVSNDPSGVMELFTKTSTATDKTQAFNESGIAQRLYNIVNNTIKAITDKAGQSNSLFKVDNSVLGLQMKDMDNRISDMEQRLTDIENRYYRQFTAMEQALNQMNAQSAWLVQQLAASQR
ncbi:flagellar filament capping protein FliD [Mahella australiensis]|uniref:Flagellar hook-associated protein 2 n=1 Tax=Mahella australiensis (strain DSM 15567 / CIP 107919 / 50-1 BON) TaxID=697281 RepID=F3ZZ81_MAHA5|nr:flagellar filament capping protein FliD [Mahella australiensis]AEE97863.1 flagellar hook-associated 2 domain-containing protein [Mahella australiensis 50-1 BON]